MRPCKMCARVCWQCEQQYARLKADYERQEEQVAALELLFSEASDETRLEISQRLQDSIEVWWSLGEELDTMESNQ